MRIFALTLDVFQLIIIPYFVNSVSMKSYNIHVARNIPICNMGYVVMFLGGVVESAGLPQEQFGLQEDHECAAADHHGVEVTVFG